MLIENTAGGNRAMARHPEALERLWEAIGEYDPGFCLDTCHAWAGGMPLPEAVDIVRAITGRIDLVHANDSQGDRGPARTAMRASARGRSAWTCCSRPSWPPALRP